MPSAFTVLLLLFSASVLVSCATLGIVEISDKIDDVSCLTTSFESGLVRGYLSTGMVDPNLSSNLKVLLAAKFNANIYMNPCVKCGNATGQVDAMFAAIEGKNIPYSFVGIYVSGDQWGKDKSANNKFLHELIVAITSHYTFAIIITDKYQWEKIIGEKIKDLLLCDMIYVNVDRKDNCHNYEPFGGWDEALGKKYESGIKACGYNVGVIHLCSTDLASRLRDKLAHAVTAANV